MIASIELFEALKTKFGDAEAKVIVKEIEKIEASVETKIEKTFEQKKDSLATKQDVSNLLKWMIVMWITQLGAIVAITKLM